MKNVLVLKKKHSLKDVIKVIDDNSNGYVILVKEDYTLIGIITDGDIRRAVLNNKVNLKSVINYNPVFILQSNVKDEALNLLRYKGISQLPVVDDQNKLVDVIDREKRDINFKTNYVIIMAGGLGSRLGSLTKDTPKPMLNVGGRPLLENIIKSFIESGFNNFIICVNYKSNIIENYFKDGSKLGVKISYVKEDKRMGTAGALSLIEIKFNQPFFVVNGDILTTVKFENLLEYHKSKKSIATMGVKRFEYQLPYGTINIDKNDRMIKISEKPKFSSLINAGIYVLSPEVISLIPKKEFYNITTLFEKTALKFNNVFTFPIDEYWLDIGHESDYEKANNDIKINKS